MTAKCSGAQRREVVYDTPSLLKYYNVLKKYSHSLWTAAYRVAECGKK